VRAARQQALPQAKAKAKDPNFNGGTATQQADTRIAHANAQYFAAQAFLQLTTTPGSSNTLYTEWFGAFNQGRYDTIAGHYSDINKVLETESVTYDFNGSDCKPSYFAYTYSGSRTVWLCGQYLSASQIGTDCKFGTLIHEWSHAVTDTEDHVYGETSARDPRILIREKQSTTRITTSTLPSTLRSRASAKRSHSSPIAVNLAATK
jgi:hypothetical protein